MTSALSSLTANFPFSLPAVEAFPTSISVIYLAGLEEYLNTDTIAQLKGSEAKLREHADFGLLLRARTPTTFQAALHRAFEAVVEYYVESGILIWRALNHDHDKLLRLSQISCATIDSLFFQNVRLLERDTFIKAVAGIRILGKLGEWVTIADKDTEGSEPLDYLGRVVLATFFTSCLLSYVAGEVKRPVRANLQILAEGILAVATEAYQSAVNAGLRNDAAEEQGYWSPSWQLGEVEADLDKQLGRVKSFSSVDALLADLHAR